MRNEFCFVFMIFVLRVASGPRVKLADRKVALTPPPPHPPRQPRGDLSCPCVILFLYFSILLALRLPRLEKRELILGVFVLLFDLRLFCFVCFLFLFVSGMGCGL